MKVRIAVSILAASILALTSMSSFAGQGNGPGGPSVDRGHQVDRDRNYDRDRMSDRDRARDRARSDDPQQDRDRDRLQDPAKIKDGDIYGNEMMSVQERNQYRKQLRVMNSGGGQEKFQAQHEEKMRIRALEQGKDLVPPGQGPIYGGEFMSVQERNQYREQLRVMGSDEEREKFQARHRDRVKQRAKALNMEVEEAE